MDIFHPAPVGSRVVDALERARVTRALPGFVRTITEECDADTARFGRGDWPYSLAQLAVVPIDGRKPERTAQ